MSPRTPLLVTLLIQSAASTILVWITTVSVQPDVRGLWPFLLAIEMALALATSCVVSVAFKGHPVGFQFLLVFNAVLLLARLLLRQWNLTANIDWSAVNSGTQLGLLDQIRVSNLTQLAPYLGCYAALVMTTKRRKHHAETGAPPNSTY